MGPDDSTTPATGRFVTVAVCSDPVTASVVTEILKERGIPHTTVGEHASAVFGAPSGVATRFHVPEAHAAAASDALAAEGLAFRESQPEADAAVERLEEEETKRTGVRPLYLFLLLLLVVALRVACRAAG
jgi:hypothetical protein